MPGYSIEWNGVAQPAQLVVENIDRDMLGEHHGVFVHIPGRAGSWYFPDERGRRLVECHCYILAPTFPAQRRAYLTEVADWLDINGEAALILGDDPEVYYKAVLVDAPNLKEWRNLGRFDLVFSIDPWAYANDASAEDFLARSSGVDWTYDFDIGTATYPVIEVTNRSGFSVTGFTLTINNSSLIYEGVIADDATITINSIGMAVLAGANNDTMLTGVYEPEDMLMSLVEGTFPILMPGTNDLEIVSATPSAVFDVRILYRKRYRN